MNWDTIEGSWKEMTGKAKAKWGDVTGDDWASITGRRDEIVGLVQKQSPRCRETPPAVC